MTQEDKELLLKHVSEDLEEEFVSYIKEKFGVRQEGNTLKTDGLSISPYDLLDIANHFANWQKEQMMKDTITINFSPSLPCEIFNPLWINGAKDGDNIKIQIIKEAEK